MANPFHFEYGLPDPSGSSDLNLNAFDIKLKHICNHQVNGVQYKSNTCPRCLGDDYYYDIKFSALGYPVEISNEDKLAQLLEKILLTELNRFHPEIAVNIKQWIGKVPIEQIKAIIKLDLLKALNTLQVTQEGVINLSTRAQIANVNNIEIVEIDVDHLQYIVDITTVSGESRALTGTITFGTNT